MARVAFDIDKKIKREIKVRLAKEGRTLSEVMRTFCSHYKDFGLYPGQQVSWENRDALPNVSAVYFVYTKGMIQYIGQTKSLHTRLANHHRDHQFAELGVSIFWIEAPADTLIGLESWFIDTFKPPLNGAEVLYTQGQQRRFSISLDEDKMEKLNELAKSTGRTKSGLIGLLVSWMQPTEFGGVELNRNGNDIPQDS